MEVALFPLICVGEIVGKCLPTATFVNPGRSMSVKLTTAQKNHAFNSHAQYIERDKRGVRVCVCERERVKLRSKRIHYAVRNFVRME